MTTVNVLVFSSCDLSQTLAQEIEPQHEVFMVMRHHQRLQSREEADAADNCNPADDPSVRRVLASDLAELHYM